MPRKIVLDYWQKPIPMRFFDWCAMFDDYEPGAPAGYGATEKEAIAELLMRSEEREELERD